MRRFPRYVENLSKPIHSQNTTRRNESAENLSKIYSSINIWVQTCRIPLLEKYALLTRILQDFLARSEEKKRKVYSIGIITKKNKIHEMK